MNPFDIGVPCIKIAVSEKVFEHYRMALNWDKYDIEVQNYYAIKCNQIFFDLMQRMFNHLNVLYLREKIILIYTIMKYQFRKQSAAEIENMSREKFHKIEKGRYI